MTFLVIFLIFFFPLCCCFWCPISESRTLLCSFPKIRVSAHLKVSVESTGFFCFPPGYVLDSEDRFGTCWVGPGWHSIRLERRGGGGTAEGYTWTVEESWWSCVLPPPQTFLFFFTFLETKFMIRSSTVTGPRARPGFSVTWHQLIFFCFQNLVSGP